MVRPSRIAALLLLAASTPSMAGVVYGLKSRAVSAISEPPTRLFRFQAAGGGFVDIGGVTLGGTAVDADALAISGAGRLYGYALSSNGSTLISISATTAAASTIGSALSGRDIRGAAFDSAGVLRVLDSARNELLAINPLTGLIVGAARALTLGGNAFDLGNVTDIAQRADGTFFVTDLNRIYTLNVATGALTLAYDDTTIPPGSLSQALAGAAFSADFSPSALFAYEINGTDDIFRYATTGGFARTTVFSNIIPSFNAGRGDLAAAPPAVPEPATWIAAAFAVIATAWRARLDANHATTV